MPETNQPAVAGIQPLSVNKQSARGAIIRDSWRCPQDGQINFGDSCTNCSLQMPQDLSQPNPLPTIRALHAKFHNWLVANRGSSPPGVPSGTPKWLAMSLEDVERSEAALAALLSSNPKAADTRDEAALVELRSEATRSGN